ncbi:hypothetical protein DER46DRAFT_474722, partial [Fusarium sp. MPI-SDFR-AT-0072]
YAILFRRWGSGKIFLPQLDKILGVCITALRQVLHWIWIDDCCINKFDNSKLSKCINSMFKW